MRIRLSADKATFDRDVRQAQDRLRGYTAQAKAANDGNINLEAGFRKASSGAAVLYGPLDGVSGRLSSMATLLGRASAGWIGLGAGVSAGAAALMGGMREAEKTERFMLRTEAQLRATRYAAGFTADSLDEMARRVALNTMASTDGIRKAQNTLLTFKAVAGDVFEKTIELAQDMTEILETDTAGAAMQLGKALENPEQGITALKRSGISFTDTQKEVIKTLWDTGRTADAQMMILQALEDQVGGSAAAGAGGLSGASDTLGQRWSEMLEQLNETTGASNIAAAGINRVADAIHGLTKAMAGDAGKSLEELNAEYDRLMERVNQYPTTPEGWRKIPDINPFGSAVAGGKSKNEFNNLQNELAAIGQHRRAIYQKQEEQAEAERKSAEEQARMQEERDAERARKEQERLDQEAQRRADAAAREMAQRQDAGARTLAQLDTQYASELERLQLAHEQKMRDLEALQLSENELRRRGFDSLEQLRAEYRERERAHYEQEREEYQLRREEELQKALEAEQKKQAAITKEHEDALRKREEAEKRVQEQLLSLQMSAAGNAVGMMKQAAAEGSAVWIAATIAQRGLMVAQAIMHANLAATMALTSMQVAGNPASTPAALAMAEKMRMMGYLNAGLIAGQGLMEIAGARANGGQVIGSRAYLVGERGPELFVPGVTGQVTSHENLQKAVGAGGGAPVIFELNYYEDGNRVSGDAPGFVQMMFGQMRVIAQEVIHNEMRPGGALNRR
jgi:hypothetical protein